MITVVDIGDSGDEINIQINTHHADWYYGMYVGCSCHNNEAFNDRVLVRASNDYPKGFLSFYERLEVLGILMILYNLLDLSKPNERSF